MPVDYKTVFWVLALVGIEMVAEFLLQKSANDTTKNMAQSNEFLYALLLYIAMPFLIYNFFKLMKNEFATANTYWQVLNLVLGAAIAQFVLKENLSYVNFIGVLTLIIGAFMISWKKNK